MNVIRFATLFFRLKRQLLQQVRLDVDVGEANSLSSSFSCR